MSHATDRDGFTFVSHKRRGKRSQHCHQTVHDPGQLTTELYTPSPTTTIDSSLLKDKIMQARQVSDVTGYRYVAIIATTGHCDL
jgi:hypothetical protein